jgi:hypothetical protein
VSPYTRLTQAHTIHLSPMYLTREIYSNTALCKMRCVSSIQKRGGQPHHPINRCIYTCTILPWVSSWMCVCVVLVSVNTRSMEDVLCQPTGVLFLTSFLGQVCGAAGGWGGWWQRGGGLGWDGRGGERCLLCWVFVHVSICVLSVRLFNVGLCVCICNLSHRGKRWRRHANIPSS